MSRLHNEGFQPYCHQRIPPNDGGIALGQALGAFFSNQFPDDSGS
jgi:hydrogenase maturation protein HypF